MNVSALVRLNGDTLAADHKPFAVAGKSLRETGSNDGVPLVVYDGGDWLIARGSVRSLTCLLLKILPGK
jgi:hypothetical protein